MRIKRLTARFGRLDGTVAFDPERLNLVLDGNEQGKSTLVAAVLAALYGLPAEKGPGKKDLLKERDRYQPLTGQRFEVALELEVGGRGYEIHRDFDHGTVAVRDALSSADLTPEFLTGKDRYDVGGILLGLSREQFLKSALVRQGELGAVDGAADLTRKLEAALSTHEGDHTAAEAIAALRDALGGYDGVTSPGRIQVDTEIKRLEERVAGIDAQLAELDDGRRRVDAELAELDRLDREAADLAARRESTRYLAALAELAEVRARLQEHGHAREQVERLRRQAEELRPYASVRPEDRREISVLQGRADTAAAEIERLEGRLRQAGEALAQTESRLRAYPGFQGFTEDDRDEALRLRQSLDEALDRRHRARQELADALEDAARRGVDLTRAGELDARLGGLSPEDGRFVVSFTQARYEHEREIERLAGGLQEAGAASRPAASRRLPFVLAGGLLLAGLVLLALLPPAGLALLLAAGGALLYGILTRRGGGRSVEDEAARLLRLRDLEAARERLRAHDERAGGLAAALGYADVGSLVADYGLYLDVRAEQAAVRQLEAAAREAEDAAAARRREAAALWRRAGREVPPERADAAALDELLEGLRAYLALQAERARWEEETAEARQEIDRRTAEREDALRAVREIAGRYGIAAGTPEAALQELEDLLWRREELERLESAAIPAWERRVLDNREVLTLTGRADQLEAALRDMRSRQPALESLRAEVSAASYHDRDRDLTRQMEEILDRRSRILQTAGTALDAYKERYPRLLEEREEAATALRRARDFRAAAGLALQTLERIAAESHRDWAQALNREAARVLPALSARYVDMRFEGDLSFTVWDRDGTRWDRRAVHSQLSAGTRDQIYLALRTVLARCFSAEGVSVPLILDDPFVTSDDARFQSGMRFLLDQIAPSHQVIVTSCHQRRHRDLFLAADPAAADRVHVIQMADLLRDA